LKGSDCKALHDGKFAEEVQYTLQSEVEIAGEGIFTGARTSVRVCPMPPNTGIVFARGDLPFSPLIPAHFSSVQPSVRCTTVSAEGVSVILVEHLLSALYACHIDNAKVIVFGPEIPILDGSSQGFIEAFERVGIIGQEEKCTISVLQEPVSWSKGPVHLVALPASELRFSYVLHYPQSPFLKSQYYSFALDPDGYRKEIAPCRTFSLYEEVVVLMEKGVIRGGGLNSAVVIQGTEVLNPGGLRFPDEMVRHKILDLLGDLSLVGVRFYAHVIAICSGHEANVCFAEKISEKLQLRSLCGS
jgi:UDP-3-O-[3-hydroxymyristoyl] N-acetylglucosamine deacetylase